MTGHGLTGTADAGAFLARLVRFDPATVVRLRPVPGAGRTALWARLPWGVLVVRTVPGTAPGDVTVAAGELLAELSAGGAALPVRRDDGWRWQLPPAASRAVEALPGAELLRIADAAALTLREAAAHGVGGRAVGQRVLRDALLDHVAVVVTPDEAPGNPVEVSQRLVQALVRMGFLGTGEDDVQVRAAGRWVGLVGPFGSAWSRSVADLALRPTGGHPKG
ncbi:hypothetical protein ACQP26_24155 [Micromonospora sp. CA-248089]|uniref:hypothetical protein n=1 Tax=unclassified Micromonospora TaxID=2617518 RepID=UPI00248B13FA|nr:hypothetical protein [Micromonospora sp. WMMA1947]WBC06677.1 hypothetical protein O7604_15570 [Micromonospora sp. WMMA1947]